MLILKSFANRKFWVFILRDIELITIIKINLLVAEMNAVLVKMSILIRNLSRVLHYPTAHFLSSLIISRFISAAHVSIGLNSRTPGSITFQNYVLSINITNNHLNHKYVKLFLSVLLSYLSALDLQITVTHATDLPQQRSFYRWLTTGTVFCSVWFKCFLVPWNVVELY